MKWLARPRLRRSFLGAASQDQTSLCTYRRNTCHLFKVRHKVACGTSGGQGWTGPIVVLAAIEPENVRFSGSQDDTFMHGAMHDKKAAFPQRHAKTFVRCRFLSVACTIWIEEHADPTGRELPRGKLLSP